MNKTGLESCSNSSASVIVYCFFPLRIPRQVHSEIVSREENGKKWDSAERRNCDLYVMEIQFRDVPSCRAQLHYELSKADRFHCSF